MLYNKKCSPILPLSTLEAWPKKKLTRPTEDPSEPKKSKTSKNHHSADEHEEVKVGYFSNGIFQYEKVDQSKKTPFFMKNF